jgi:hypothetical protein
MPIKQEEVAETPEQPTQLASNASSLTQESWLQVLGQLKKQHNTLYGVARMAQPDFSEPGKLELAFAFAFHQKRLNDAKNREIISEAVATVTGQQVDITCSYNPELKGTTLQPSVAVLPEPVTAAKPSEDPSLSAISNIFGGGELLQS